MVENTKTVYIYTKLPRTIPNVNKIHITKDCKNGPSVQNIYQHLPLQDPPNFPLIWIFGLITNHPATLLPNLLTLVNV
jgi:hypothetical protein